MVWRVLLATVSLFLVGCGQPATANRIFSSRPAVTAVVPPGQPLSVDIGQLQQAPEAYEDTLVRIIGEYRRAPVVVCDGITRSSPATWWLGQGQELIGANGFENLVHVLLPPGLTISVDGVWRSWRGPVGCGKDAPLQSVWYLAVTDIVSPRPVARVTLTPAGGAPASTPFETQQAPAETGTPSGPEPVGTPLTEPSPTNRPATIPAAGTSPANTPVPNSTATPSPNAEEEESTVEPVETSQATATLDGTTTVTATATANGEGDVTATATVGATATPGGTVVDKGSIGMQDLRGGRLNSAETNSWRFSVQTGDVITISVAARADTDIAVAVLDPAGNRVADQNNSAAGEIETIAGLEVQGSGEYRVVLSEATGGETYYSLLILNSNYADYYPFIFAGILSYGSNVTTSLAEATDQFWFFYGNAQEIVNINVAPTDQSDLFFDLFGPEGDQLEETFDDAGSGGSEQLRNFVLPSTGMFAIRVGEFAYEPSNYTILVSRN